MMLSCFSVLEYSLQSGYSKGADPLDGFSSWPLVKELVKLGNLDEIVLLPLQYELFQPTIKAGPNSMSLSDSSIQFF